MRQAREVLRAVERELGPPPLPVYFRSKELSDCSGRTFKRDDSFLVYLDSRLGADEQWWVVLHELAHVYAWVEGGAYRGDHDEVWGVVYARIYCAAMGAH
jgi:hypothetical protein